MVEPHVYESGVGHMTHPDDVISCCPYGSKHPIHIGQHRETAISSPDRRVDLPSRSFWHRITSDRVYAWAMAKHRADRP